jgi:cell division protein FtsN
MASNVKTQRGGFGGGMVVGLLVGLVMALGVALYVTKAPVPFIDKVPQRSAEQDAAEAEKNRHWDPNAPLYGKNPARPQAQPAEPAAAAAVAATDAPASAPAPAVKASAAARTASAVARGASDSASSARAAGDPFTYFVQVGAYTSSEDAEQQRAKLAMNGLKARITEREQSGRTMYRVRLGPFETRDDAERVRDQSSASGYGEAALVRVPR